MAETINPETQIAPEPELTKRIVDPKGVLQKNMKLVLYLSAALLVIVAAVFSSSGKKTVGAQAATKNQSPQPTVQDNTDNNVAELKSQLQAEQLKEQQEAASNALPQGGTPAQQSAAAAYGPTGQPLPCASGQPCSQAYGQQANGQSQLTPERQQAQQLAAKERELAYNSRFASNLAYARSADAPAPSPATDAIHSRQSHADRACTESLRRRNAIWQQPDCSTECWGTNAATHRTGIAPARAGGKHRLRRRPAVCDL